MMPRLTINAILKEIGCDKLQLHRGRGYFYFEYDDGALQYRTRSVHVYALGHLPLKEWAEEGRAVVREVENPDAPQFERPLIFKRAK